MGVLCVGVLCMGLVTGGVAAAAPPAVSSTAQSSDGVPVPPEIPAGEVPRSACGTPLDDADLTRLRDLTAPDPAPAESTLAELERLADRSRQRPAFVAMTGYNAHLTVDLARAVAASGTRPEDVTGYLEIVGGIADHRNLIIDRTRQAYGADLGPLWNAYVVGPALEVVTGPGVGSGALLRFGEQAYSTLAFAHGIALQDPALAPAAGGQVLGLWVDADVALQTITALDVL